MPTSTEAETKRKRSREEAHNELVLEVCQELGLELVAAIPKISSGMAVKRGKAYGSTLAFLLQHLPLRRTGNGVPAWKEPRELLLKAFNKLASLGIDDLPAPLDLVIQADYALWFPGGTEIRETFALDPILIRGGGPSLITLQLTRYDVLWSRTMERIAYDKLDDAAKQTWNRPIPGDTCMAATRHNWVKEGREADWDTLQAWMRACRSLLMMPKPKERA